MNAILILIIVIIALFHILWYMASRRYQNRQLPNEKVLRQYKDNIFQQMQMTVDRSVMEETYIDANGYRST